CGADINDIDIRVADDILIVERRGCRLGEGFDFRKPVRANFANMQLPAQRRARQGFGADASAPTGTDHGGFGSFPHVLRACGLISGKTVGWAEARLRAVPTALRLWWARFALPTLQSPDKPWRRLTSPRRNTPPCRSPASRTTCGPGHP